MGKKTSTNAINKEKLEKDCDIAYTSAVISGRWKVSILTCLLDSEKIRYTDLRKRLTGISEKVLTSQLKELEANGIISKILHAAVPPRVEYFLTEKGMAIAPVLEAMLAWGKQYRIKSF